MCLLVWVSGWSEEFPFVLVGNRDEYFDRETSSAFFWKEDHPHLLAGRDLRRGGTWLGINRDGRLAGLTNFRTPFKDIRANASSRGDLLVSFLTSTQPPQEFLQRIATGGEDYNEFNIIVGDIREPLWYYGTQHQDRSPQQTEEGKVYSVSNAVLDTPWWKQERAREAFTQVLTAHTKSGMGSHKKEHGVPGIALDLLNAFGDKTRCAVDDLPDTGVSKEWEEEMSSIFVETPKEKEYGTRSQVVVLLDRDNKVTLVERSMELDSLKRTSDGVPVSFNGFSWHLTCHEFHLPETQRVPT